MSALAEEHATMPVLGRLPATATRAELVEHIAEAARQIRIQDVKLVHYAGAGHIGGDFSAIDILATLYGAVLDVTPQTAADPERDRFFLSKGHVAGALYTTLAAFGFLEVAELATFLKPQSRLNGHPNRRKVPGVEANTGPLGHGLPIAVGHALSAKLDVSLRRTYVLTGDGELQEGSNWEAMMAASQYQLDHLTVIVDRNRLQQGATVKETNDLDPLADKAAAFGFAVVEVNGHDHGELLDVLSAVPFRPSKPTFVIAHTHKGHPISFMSNNVAWHHKVPSADQLTLALDELEHAAPVGVRRTHDRHVDPADIDRRPTPLRLPGRVRRHAFRARPRRPSHRRCGQRLDRLEQAGRLQEGLPRPADQRRHRRAGHGGRGRRPGQWRPDPVRLGRLLLPHRPRAGADQGRRRVLRPQRQAVRDEPGDGVRGAGPDAPFDRGHRLAAGHRQHDNRGAGRPRRNRGRAALGSRQRTGRCSSG